MHHEDYTGDQNYHGILLLIAGVAIVLTLLLGGNKPNTTYGDGNTVNSYNRTTYSYQDNDTTVCIGFCPQE